MVTHTISSGSFTGNIADIGLSNFPGTVSFSDASGEAVFSSDSAHMRKIGFRAMGGPEVELNYHKPHEDSTIGQTWTLAGIANWNNGGFSFNFDEILI